MRCIQLGSSVGCSRFPQVHFVRKQTMCKSVYTYLTICFAFEKLTTRKLCSATLNSLFKAISTAKYVNFLQRVLYLLVAMSGTYTGRFLLQFNFHFQYNNYYYGTSLHIFSWISVRQVVLENKYLLLHSCRLVARKQEKTQRSKGKR